MILQQIKNLEVQKVGDLNEGITAGIAEESMPFVFELVSKQLYSNPIGSIIREITSNCFDSHIEAGVDDPVIISQSYSVDEGYAIEFKDVGVGLSPERVEKIFMNYFSSTKRGDNTQIGGFGIGSKTPLAYADMFYITTIYEGTKYQYLLHKGESKPVLESLLGYNEEYYTDTFYNEELDLEEEIEVYRKEAMGEPTEEHNGTTIKINIERNDLSKFTEELKFQLAYFDNVYFSKWNINNQYDIYEGDFFKFRSDMPQSQYSHSSEIHLCIGKVRYPIDFDKVSIPQSYRQIPVAVKFEIGELNVTPSRETLRYSPETIKLIQDRVKQAANEILELFEAQNPEIEDLDTYIKIMSDTPRITFDEAKRHYLYLWSHSGISKNFKFKPLAGLPIKKTPNDLFFMWKKIGYIQNGKRTDFNKYDTQTVSNRFILEGRYVIVGKDDKFSSYTDIYIDNEILPGRNTIYLIKRQEVNYEEVSKSLGIDKSKDVRKAKVIYDYLKIMNEIVHKNGYFYKDLRATDEWINEYKKSIRESSAAYQRKINQKIFVRDAGSGFKGKELKVFELQQRKGILIYGFKEDQEILRRIHTTVTKNKKSIRVLNTSHYSDRTHNYMTYSKQELAFMVIQVAKGVEKDLLGDKKNNKIIHWTKFFGTKFFRKIETSYYIYNQFNNLDLPSKEYRKKFCINFKEDYKAVEDSITDYRNEFVIPSHYLSGNLIPGMLTPLVNFIEKHSHTKLYLASSLITNHLSGSDLQEVVDYLKYKKFKLRKEYYLKSKQQLKYEEGVKKILQMFKHPVTNLLTYTLNQTENVNIEENSISISKERGRPF